MDLWKNWNIYQVVDFTVHISEAGEKYNEKIEVDPNKRTELFQVPAHPGVDRSDTLHDFKQVSCLICFSLSRLLIQLQISCEGKVESKALYWTANKKSLGS